MQLMALERSFEPGGFEETVGTGAEKQRQPIRGWLELAAQILVDSPDVRLHADAGQGPGGGGSRRQFLAGERVAGGSALLLGRLSR